MAVGQAGERVAELFLGAGAGDPEGGVQRDERDREQRQQQGCVEGADGDQRGDAQQRDADECLAEYGRSGDGGQLAGARGEADPQEAAADEEVAGGGDDDFGEDGQIPGRRGPGVADAGDHAERGEAERRGADAEDVHGTVHHGLSPAVPAGGADQDDDGEADEGGGHPAVEQQDGEGQGGAGARAAPPAVPAEGDQMADDDAGEDRQRPAYGTAGEQRVTFAESDDDARGEREARHGDDGRGQRGHDEPPEPRRRSGAVGRFHSDPSHSRLCPRHGRRTPQQ